MAARFNPERRGPSCSSCGSPTGGPWGPQREDGVIQYCVLCAPTISRPTVHLYGAPSGQELARWTDGDLNNPVHGNQGDSR